MPRMDGDLMTEPSIKDAPSKRGIGSEAGEASWTADGPDSHDCVTGLAHRQSFQNRLGWMLVAGARQPERPALLMVDLDRFKPVSDSFGRRAGDALLCLVAGRLRATLRDGDLLGRVGGDEFAVALPAGSAAAVLAARLVDILGRPYLVQGKIANIGANVGIAFAEDGIKTDQLIRHADLALHHAKAEGGRGFRVFDPEMDQQARLRQSLEADLRKALPLRQLELHYQPQVSLQDQRLVGFEALLRWRHPERGLVPPADFIPMAEEIGLIVPIGEWALRTACKQAARWSGELTVAVNVSAVQLQDGARLVRTVRGALEAAALPGHRLDVEITESALVRRADETLAVLHELRGMGVRVSMDDFGTGYSSLSQLRSFPFTKIKIDRSFIQDLERNPEGMAVVRAIIALGTTLGMSTTAEGVETMGQAAIVRAEGCSDMQGYFTSCPLPPAEAESFATTYDPSRSGPFQGRA